MSKKRKLTDDYIEEHVTDDEIINAIRELVKKRGPGKTC